MRKHNRYFFIHFQYSHEADILHELDYTACIKLAVRGTNQVGLWSSSLAEVGGCSEETRSEQLIMDAVGTWDEDISDVR